MKIMKRFEEGLIGMGIIVATFVLFVNIVLRYFFQANTTWAEEFIRYVMIWITFIGASVCFSSGLHVGIDFFLEYLSSRWKLLFGIFVNIVSIIFMIFLLFFGIELVKFSVDSGQITPSLQIKMYWIYLGIPVGATLSIIHLLVKTFSQIKGFMNQSQSMQTEENQK